MTAAFLDALDERARADLERRSMARSLASGETLFREGEPALEVLILVAGLVKAVSVNEDGQESLLALRGPGEILGELAAVDGGTRSASVVALEDIEALAVPLDAFQTFLLDHPRAAMALVGAVADRLRDASRRQAEFGTLDATVRVARTLAELAHTYGEPVPDGIRLRLLSQEELANLCGASREAVARALRSLREKGAIRTARRTVVITDIERLRH